MYKKSNILVVGGAGFVGANLVNALIHHEVNKVVIVDNLLSSNIENIPKSPAVNFIYGSITDDKVLSKLHDEFDYIFHLATFHGNQNSMYDPLMDHENNTLTTLKLLEKIKGFKRLKKFIYSSAGCTVAQKTYDSPEETTEEDPISLYLDSPYQISKIIGEFYLNYYYKQYGTPIIKARFQNVYGPGEILGAGEWRGTISTVWRNVTPVFIYKVINDQPLELDNEGENTRDFIYVSDLVEGLLLCGTEGRVSEVYNLASGVETSIKVLSEHIYAITNKPANYVLREKRSWDHSGRRFGSTEKARNELGFTAKTSLYEGLEKTIQWTQKNIEYIEKSISRHKDRL